MLTEVDRDLWIADGPRLPFLGAPYPTRMTSLGFATAIHGLH